MLQVSELSGRHDRESFDCGNPALNNYLRQIAGQHVRKSLARVYVACEESDPGRIVAYYALNGCEINSQELPAPLRKKFPGRIPAVRLGRLAVAAVNQSQGLGEQMLFHAMWNVAQVDGIIGAAALLVDAKDPVSKRFYVKYGFLELPDRTLTLFLPIARVRQAAADVRRQPMAEK
ncbi:MAG: GNAT family N-acetyltransferase [Betaproteobacteria bacterium]|nr:GNAT family N-acetyltransferase [Betaproteobacteria bacterium]